MMERTGLVSVRRAAELLGVSACTIRRLIDSDDLKAVYVGARLLISDPEIDRALRHGVGKRRSRKSFQDIPR